MTSGEQDPRRLRNGSRAGAAAAEALSLIAPLAAAPAPSHQALFVHSFGTEGAGSPRRGAAGQSQGDTRSIRRAVCAWHNLAATLGDIGRAGEAKAAAEKAFALKLDAPETWLVYARALRSLHEFDAAERRVPPSPAGIARRYVRCRDRTRAAHMDAQRRCSAACRSAGRRGTRRRARDSRSSWLSGGFLNAGRSRRRAARDARRRHCSGTPTTCCCCWPSRRRRWKATDEALRRAVGRAARKRSRPTTSPCRSSTSRCSSPRWRAQEALARARRATELEPDNQAAWGWLATSARASGDPAYRWLYDYDAFVRAHDVAAPAGWSSVRRRGWRICRRPAALARPVCFIPGADRSRRRPDDDRVDPGRRSGGRGFFAAIEAPIQEYMAAVGDEPSHPLTRPQHAPAQAQRLVVGAAQAQRIPRRPLPSDGLAVVGLLCRGSRKAPRRRKLTRAGFVSVNRRSRPCRGWERSTTRGLKPGGLVLFPSLHVARNRSVHDAGKPPDHRVRRRARVIRLTEGARRRPAPSSP